MEPGTLSGPVAAGSLEPVAAALEEAGYRVEGVEKLEGKTVITVSGGKIPANSGSGTAPRGVEAEYPEG